MLSKLLNTVSTSGKWSGGRSSKSRGGDFCIATTEAPALVSVLDILSRNAVNVCNNDIDVDVRVLEIEK